MDIESKTHPPDSNHRHRHTALEIKLDGLHRFTKKHRRICGELTHYLPSWKYCLPADCFAQAARPLDELRSLRYAFISNPCLSDLATDPSCLFNRLGSRSLMLGGHGGVPTDCLPSFIPHLGCGEAFLIDSVDSAPGIIPTTLTPLGPGMFLHASSGALPPSRMPEESQLVKKCLATALLEQMHPRAVQQQCYKQHLVVF